MIRRLAWWVTEQCLPDGDEIEQEVVAYGLECRISDWVQVAVLAALGLAFRCMMEMLWFSAWFTILKLGYFISCFSKRRAFQ